MMAALDDELSGPERQVLDEHLGACAACREEEAQLRRLHAALGLLPSRTEVPGGLEQATLRRVRAALAKPAEGPGWLETLRAWWWLPVPVAAALALVVALRELPPSPGEPAPGGDRIAATDVPAGAGSVEPGRTATAEPRPGPKRAAGEPKAAPAEPPPAVIAMPELFLDLPVLEHLEKLQNYETIRTVDLGDNGRTGDTRG